MFFQNSFLNLFLPLIGIGFIFLDVFIAFKNIKTQGLNYKIALRVFFMIFILFFLVATILFAPKKDYIKKYFEYKHKYERLEKECGILKNNYFAKVLNNECYEIDNIKLMEDFYRCRIFNSFEKCAKYLKERRLNEFNIFNK